MVKYIWRWENTAHESLPRKPFVPSLSRPNKELIDDMTKAYTEAVLSTMQQLPS